MTTRREPGDILGELHERGEARKNAVEEGATLDMAIGELLREASDHPGVTVAEAARSAGVRRDIAYRLMAKVGGSGNG